MRWITFSILLYVAAALQSARLLALTTRHYPVIEYLPLLAIFYALFASEEAAPLCGFWCGVVYDLLSPEKPIGTYAVPLALVAYMVVKIRLSIFREHIISQIIVAMLGILLFAVLAAILQAILGAPELSRSSIFWAVLLPLSINALYSGAAAPLLFWIMLRLRPILGFDPPRGRKR